MVSQFVYEYVVFSDVSRRKYESCNQQMYEKSSVQA